MSVRASKKGRKPRPRTLSEADRASIRQATREVALQTIRSDRIGLGWHGGDIAIVVNEPESGTEICAHITSGTALRIAEQLFQMAAERGPQREPSGGQSSTKGSAKRPRSG